VSRLVPEVDQSPSFVSEGRLTLTSGVPVTTSDVTAAGTLYFALYQGNRVRLFNGAAWQMKTFSERSLALTLTSGKNYDVFLYDNAGTLTLELSAAWTNDTARADALTTQDGVYVKSGATTRLYLGTIRASAANQTEDSAAKRFVWNMYNRIVRRMSAVDTTDSWNYTSAAFRQANASAANQLAFVRGLNEDVASARVWARVSSASSLAVASGIGLDSSTVNSATVLGTRVPNNHAGSYAEYNGVPGLGYHDLRWLEYSEATGTTTWYGDSALTFWQSGIVGTVMA